MSELARQLFVGAWSKNNHVTRASVEALARDAVEAAEVFEAVEREHWQTKVTNTPRPLLTGVAGPGVPRDTVTSTSTPLPGFIDWVRGR